MGANVCAGSMCERDNKLDFNGLNILAVCQNYWPEPFNVHEICATLVEHNNSVTVLTGIPNYPTGTVPKEYKNGKNRVQVKDGVRILRVPVVPRGESLAGFGFIKRAANYLSFSIMGLLKSGSLRGFDIVLAFEFSPMFMVEPAIRVAKKNGIPLFMYAIDLWPEDLLTGGVHRDGWLFKIMKRYSQSRYQKADALAVTSLGFTDYIKKLGVRDKRFVFLPQYAEGIFENCSASASQERKQETDFNLVFAGNIGGNQTLESVVEAMSLLPRDSRARLNIYGGGSHEVACRRMAEELKLTTRVIFHGRLPLEQMPEVYASAHALVLSLGSPDTGSLVPKYTIPRKLQSYMASGKPILSCSNGSASEIVRRSGCGITCEPGSPSSIAHAIKLLESLKPCELDGMGSSARSFYLENFSSQKFFDVLESELAILAKGSIG